MSDGEDRRRNDFIPNAKCLLIKCSSRSQQVRDCSRRESKCWSLGTKTVHGICGVLSDFYRVLDRYPKSNN